MSKQPGVDLYNYVKKHGNFTEETLRPLAKHLLEILSKIHAKGVIHKDIKPENIIYDKETDYVSLIDFENKETETFASPEQVRKDDIGKESDIWSLGITLYALVRNITPFCNNFEVLKKEIIYPKTWSEDFRDFLTCLLQREKVFRYTAIEALNHPWINQ